MLNQPTSSPMMTKMLGFGCAVAGAAVMAASASKVVAAQLTGFKNLICRSLRYTLLLFRRTGVTLQFRTMQVVSLTALFLEVFEGRGPLMVVVHPLPPQKVVLNAEG